MTWQQNKESRSRMEGSKVSEEEKLSPDSFALMTSPVFISLRKAGLKEQSKPPMESHPEKGDEIEMFSLFTCTPSPSFH